MASRDELVSQFADVTGVDAERVLFYLESSAWQLEVRQHILRNASGTEAFLSFVRDALRNNLGTSFITCCRIRYNALIVCPAARPLSSSLTFTLASYPDAFAFV